MKTKVDYMATCVENAHHVLNDLSRVLAESPEAVDEITDLTSTLRQLALEIDVTAEQNRAIEQAGEAR